MSQTVNPREQRGLAIAEVESNIRRIDANEYRVRSQSGNGEYQIVSTEVGWYCSCPDAISRGVKCKHIWGVEFSLKLRERVVKQTVIKPIEIQGCPKCQSEDIKKSGLRHNKSGDIQRFACNSCGYWFTVNLGFERMKASPQTVTMAMQLYFSGLSFSSTAKALKLKGVKVSSVGVYKWVKKYVALMQRYTNDITPQVGETWRTDELFIKIRGNMRYLFGMMDDETRFRIAQQVSAHKGTSNVRPMFRESIRRAGKKPSTLISDGANNFHEAHRKEFWDIYGETPSPRHIREIHLEGQVHNNKMERQNGEWRDREKVMRSLKRENSPVIAGMQLYHNFFRPHMGLKGKTPAEAAGIVVEGENPWITVIQNAAKSKLPRVNGSEEMPTS